MELLQRRAAVTVAVTFAVVLAIVLGVGQYVVNKHRWAADVLEQIEPRYARLLGLRDTGGQMEEALKQARASLSRLGHPPDRDAAQVGNDLQQVARRALQTAGLTVASSQVLAPRGEAGFERIAVALQAEGPLGAVQVALAALQSETPRVTFDSLALQATRRAADDGTPIVSCSLTVSVMRLQK